MYILNNYNDFRSMEFAGIILPQAKFCQSFNLYGIIKYSLLSANNKAGRIIITCALPEILTCAISEYAFLSARQLHEKELPSLSLSEALPMYTAPAA